MSSENISSNKVKTLNNKLFLLQHPNHKQNPMARYRRNFIAGGTFFSLSNPPTRNRTCLSDISTSRAAYMDVQNNIPLKPSPYACCQTTFTPFGRCRPTMRIIPYSGGWLKPNSPHIPLILKTYPPANSGGTNAVFGNGVFTNTPCATKRICSVARTTSIPILSNKNVAC